MAWRGGGASSGAGGSLSYAGYAGQCVQTGQGRGSRSADIMGTVLAALAALTALALPLCKVAISSPFAAFCRSETGRTGRDGLAEWRWACLSD